MTAKKKKAKTKMKLTRKEEARYVEKAKGQFHEDGTCEIDDHAKVSWAPECGGAYVQSWVWVADEEEIPFG